MLSTSELIKCCSSVNSMGDYDEIADIHTNKFTENLDKIEFLTSEHPFMFYLGGFLHGVEEVIILHGYYRKNDFTLKIYINMTSERNTSSIPGNRKSIDSNCKAGIAIAWNSYVDRIHHHGGDHSVSIYNRYCGELYQENDYDNDPKEFYKWFVSSLVEDKF